MKKIIIVLTMIISLLGVNMAWAAETDNTGVDKITLRSRVEKSVKANIATATVGVRVQSSSLSDAQRQVNEAVSAVVSALQASGVAKADIQTARFSVNSFNKDDRNQTPIYTVNNNITVKIRNLDNAGNILDAAFNAGANQMQGINFSYEGDNDIQTELLRQAVVNGRKQAGMVVNADGRSLGRLLDVNLYNVSMQAADEVSYMRAMSANKAAGSQVFSGDVVLSAEATLVFEINK